MLKFIYCRNYFIISFFFYQMTERECALKIYDILIKTYPDARTTLDFVTPEWFLFASLLSPQCTDIVNNRVMVGVRKCYKNPTDIADAPLNEVQELIHDCGLYRPKSKNMIASAKLLRDKYHGKLPIDITMEQLREFPGIGRKTALVVLTEAFHRIEGIIIDTHNIRVANRIGLVNSTSPIAVEEKLSKILPKDKWRLWSHLMLFHGRAICVARKPKCPICPIKQYCQYYKNNY